MDKVNNNFLREDLSQWQLLEFDDYFSCLSLSLFDYVKNVIYQDASTFLKMTDPDHAI